MSYLRNRIFSLASLVTAVCLVGCSEGGYHKEMRVSARERVAAFNAQLAYDQATQAFNTGRFDEAMRQIVAAIGQYPQHSAYYVLQGRILMETHRLELSIHAFEKAIELEPKFAEAHYYAGIVYQRWSDNARAYEYYHRAHELDSSSIQYLLAAAEALVALQQYDDAQVLFESKLDYFEHNSAMHQLLGQIALLKGEMLRAVKLFAEARLTSPDDEMLLEEQSLAMVATVAITSLFGAAIPLLARSLGRDPAMVSAPAITAVADLSGAVIYALTIHLVLV